MRTISLQRLNNIVRNFSRAKLLVIGDVMLDEYIWGKVTRISPEAPVPVVNVHHQTMMPGGAANVTRNVRALGAGVCLAGVLGKDASGRYLERLLKAEEVDTGGIIKRSDGGTILKTRVIAHSQQVVRIDREQSTVFAPAVEKKIFKYIEKTIADVDAVVIEDYGKGLITQGLVSFLVDKCGDYRKPLVVDPKKGHFLDYTGITAITPNMEEALSAAGMEDDGEYVAQRIKEAGRRIINKWHPRSVLITLGEHGMILFEEGIEDSYQIPVTAKEIYDVSGAGDTVVAVFTAALASGATMKEATAISNIAAGIVVGKVGTATVTRRELSGVINQEEG